MKIVKDVLIILVLLAVLLVISFGTYREITKPDPVKAQVFGTNYIWVDSIRTTTAAIDSFFTVQWEQVTIIADTVDTYMRIGASDTASWASRDWFKLEAGASVSFGPATKLRRLEWKVIGGVGYVTFIGIKKSPQF